MGRERKSRALEWLVGERQWPAAGLFTASFLLALAPLWVDRFGLALTLVYLQLPLYMLHQWEEHAGDRFRLHINRTLAGGREALTPIATFWINALGVWGVDLAAVFLACAVRPGLGLIAGYLAVVNALVHIAAAARRREYNPGLWTAIILLLPFGGWCLTAVSHSAKAGWGDHFIGLGVAASVHVAIIVHVARRLRHLSPTTRPMIGSVGRATS
jgi:uncharacterized protein with HXXEE motif